MGEQSNAYRILLRYDRKSRHRRIKKQRRYERLAATSQLSLLGVRGLNARETDHISGGAPGDPTDPHLICGPPPRGGTGAAGQPGGCAPRRPRTSRVRPAFPPARPGEADYPPNDVVPQAIMVTFLAPLASNFEGLKDR